MRESGPPHYKAARLLRSQHHQSSDERKPRCALFFTPPIPALQFTEANHLPVFKQVCVIPFRIEFLREFRGLPPTPLERAESIDMLRIIEHGRRVHLVETTVETHAVDTPEDLRLVETLMETG